jgi:serine/threonine protein phosphatase PrpC
MKCATTEESRVYVFQQGEQKTCLGSTKAGESTAESTAETFDGDAEKPQLPPTLSADEAQLAPGDAMLVCSDGFWNYLFDVEMQADLLKARSADAWLRLMLLRLIQRSYLDGDNVSVIACKVVA